MEHGIPILEALRKHLQSNPLALHVPGHKMGRGFPKDLAIWLGQALRLDLTELPGLDDLHQPEGAIREAQQLAAKVFGSDETFFLVGGSTSGNLAMILTVCRPGDTIVIPRNAHKSVHHAVMLAGARPVYLYPEVDEKFEIPTGICINEVKSVLTEHPEAKAVLITSPTYQGVCSDIEAIAKEVHRNQKLLLVDEAHGAHFTFHDALPPSAIESGADLVVQSTHKMLGSLTGSAMLHGKHSRYDGERLRTMLGMVQTSSPSYLMMLSLDANRYEMETEGYAKLDQALQVLNRYRKEVMVFPGIDLFGAQANQFQIDPFKWWIQIYGLGWSGFKGDQILRERKGIYCEMADNGHLLAVFSYADTEKQVQRFMDGLRFLEETGQARVKNRIDQSSVQMRLKFAKNGFPLEQVLFPKDALHSERHHVKLEAAAGQIAGEMVIPYPPGIPLILPGERYSSALIEYLQDLLQAGTRFQGTADPTLEFVQVIGE